MSYGTARWLAAVFLGALGGCAPSGAPHATPGGEAPHASAPTPPTEAPWVATRRYDTPCSRSAFAPDGPLRERDTWGADGVLREHLVTSPGWGTERTVQTVEAGRVRARDVLRNEALVRHEAWDYGARGEVLEHRTREGPTEQHTRYLYDDAQRLEREEHFRADALVAVTRYGYGAPGLLSVEYVDGWGVAPAVVWTERLGYFPDGGLARRERREGGATDVREYDALGHEVLEAQTRASPGPDGTLSTRTVSEHDAAGRLVRRTTRTDSTRVDTEREAVFAYDAEGRLVSEQVRSESRSEAGIQVSSSASTRALRYDARGELAREEWDLDDDGAVDRVRTYARDAFGNLLEERLSGAWEPSAPGLVGYTYECHAG